LVVPNPARKEKFRRRSKISNFTPWRLGFLQDIRPRLGLDGYGEICKLHFSAMATQANPLEDPIGDFQFPQREAAFFYGLFLRGHSAEELKRDIAVPDAVLAKWDRETEREPRLRPVLERVVRYRQHVLAIFENLVGHDSATQKLQ
jgi:hypothetical protein